MKDEGCLYYVLEFLVFLFLFTGYAVVQSFAVLFGLNLLFDLELAYTLKNLWLTFYLTVISTIATGLFAIFVKGIIRTLEGK
jgi:hypothetical protein